MVIGFRGAVKSFVCGENLYISVSVYLMSKKSIAYMDLRRDLRLSDGRILIICYLELLAHES